MTNVHAASAAAPPAPAAMNPRFTKMHALGNDFVVAAATAPDAAPDPQTVRRLADRRTGIGFDQLLLVTDAPDEGHDAGYRVFNADGGEVEQCGNGARCVARWVARHLQPGRDELRLASAGGSVHAHLLADGRVALRMPVPEFEPARIPFHADTAAKVYRRALPAGDVEFSAVSMGNPHAVLLVDSVADAPVGILGPQLETHPDFPRRTNVGFMQLIDRGRVRLRVHERGVGETRACGTGACAAVAVGRALDLLAETAVVELPGGELTIRWAGPGEPLWMTGEAVTVFEGQLDS